MGKTGDSPVKVLIVDDSAFSRQTIKGILEKSTHIQVMGVATNGRDGMEKILRFKPDVITLDLQMPEMDGFTLLRWVMEERPMPVIVVSSLGDKATVFKALELGAVDFVVKPTSKASKELEEIEEDLLRKVLDVFSLRIDKLKKSIALLGRKGVLEDITYSYKENNIEIVCIGASTGGPAAIQSILTRLPGDFPTPMVISQHMPRGFTRQFADRVSRISELTVKEAEADEALEPGKALICPGGHHMTLKKSEGKIIATIQPSSVNDRYIPSIDVMMKSIADIYGVKTMGVVLTGMGSDGKAGMLEIKKKGGFTVAESEESSVVFGMPQEVISSGGADKVLSLEEIPKEIIRKVRKRSVT